MSKDEFESLKAKHRALEIEIKELWNLHFSTSLMKKLKHEKAKIRLRLALLKKKN
jgi:hypothetical protein